jgi:hypothetical protein
MIHCGNMDPFCETEYYSLRRAGFLLIMKPEERRLFLGCIENPFPLLLATALNGAGGK